ncbi:MAG TPA: PaaI family thioesterase [bacterium]|nr:PaaI family thioesterase [bacterium]
MDQAILKTLPYSRNCFVCGIDNPRGLKRRFTSDGASVFTEFIPEPWMVGYENVIHGGIISTLLDEIVVWAAYDRTGRFSVTVELNVRFLKPLYLGQRYIVEGRFLEDRGRIWLTEAEIRNPEDVLLATATAKVFPLSEEKAAALRDEFQAPD